MAAGIDWLRKVADQPVLADQLDTRLLPKEGASLETEEERLEYVRNHISTQYHICGSAAMGEVVDDHLRVKGTRGLRVIDASVFPVSPASSFLRANRTSLTHQRDMFLGIL